MLYLHFIHPFIAYYQKELKLHCQMQTNALQFLKKILVCDRLKTVKDPL